MKRVPALTALVMLLATGTAAGDEKTNNDRDPWNGFGVGSWVIKTESFVRGDKDETTREKETRVAGKEPGVIQLQSRGEGKKAGVFDGKESTIWHIPGYDPALDPKSKLLDTSKKELEIRGKKYACEVKQYDLTRGANKATATFWHCKDASVPYREVGGPPRTLAVRPDVLRVDVDFSGKNLSQKISVRVVNLAEERKVGDKKIVCVREEGEVEIVEGDMKGKGKITLYLSNEVPGREVEMVAEGEIGGTKVRRLKRIEAFEVVKEK